MKYIELFASTITALRGNLMRTILTMLGIIIGITSVILIIALASGATSSITSELSSTGSNLITIRPGASGSVSAGGGFTGGSTEAAANDSLTYADAEALKDKTKISRVAGVSGMVSKQYNVVVDGVGDSYSVTGVSEDYQSLQTIDMAQGDFITDDEESSLEKVAVLGSVVATELFGEDSDPVGETITIDGKPFRVIGVTVEKGGTGQSSPDEVVYIPLLTGLKTLFGQEYLSTITVGVDDTKNIDQLSTDIKSLLLERHGIDNEADIDFSVGTSDDALSTVSDITGILTYVLGGIAGISLLVGGIGIMNIMLVTVTERTREIGLLKAIGAKQKDIMRQFLIEALVLTVLGGLIGVVLGVGLDYLLAGLFDIPFGVSVTAVALAVGVSTLVGVVFGLYPARKAARLNPIDALRFE